MHESRHLHGIGLPPSALFERTDNTLGLRAYHVCRCRKKQSYTNSVMSVAGE